jgi:RNA polymerase sigma-70 factor (ECF subfamily)
MTARDADSFRAIGWAGTEHRAQLDDRSDDALMARIAVGDHRAFQLLACRHVSRTLDLARRMTASRSDAE